MPNDVHPVLALAFRNLPQITFNPALIALPTRLAALHHNIGLIVYLMSDKIKNDTEPCI